MALQTVDAEYDTSLRENNHECDTGDCQWGVFESPEKSLVGVTEDWWPMGADDWSCSAGRNLGYSAILHLGLQLGDEVYLDPLSPE